MDQAGKGAGMSQAKQIAALRKELLLRMADDIARIAEDLEDFDGDRRGIAGALHDAESERDALRKSVVAWMEWEPDNG